MSAQHTPGPWAYRPDAFDDWGMVRAAPDSEGRQWVICQARAPYTTDEELSEHRRNKTDPYEANARLIAAAPDLLKSLERVIEAAERALGDHVAPDDCFATGPCTGNWLADLVVCPGCVQQNEIADARRVIAKARGEA